MFYVFAFMYCIVDSDRLTQTWSLKISQRSQHISTNRNNRVVFINTGHYSTLYIYKLQADVVIIAYLKQRFPMLNRQLRNDSHRAEDLSMLSDVMTKCLSKTSPLLESLVGSFLTATGNLLHLLRFLGIDEAHRALDMLRSCSEVAIISLDPFVWTKMTHQRVAEDFDVWPHTTRKRSVDPDYVSFVDRDSNFIAKSSVMKLVAVPSLPSMLGIVDLEISPVDSNKAIIGSVAFKSLVPINLCDNKAACQ